MPRVTFSSAAAYTVPWKERQVALHEPKGTGQPAAAEPRRAAVRAALARQLAAAARGELTAQRLGALAQFSQTALVHLQRLLQLLSGSDGGQTLQQAAQQAESGSTAQLAQLLRRVMSTPDGAALAGRIMQQLQQ